MGVEREWCVEGRSERERAADDSNNIYINMRFRKRSKVRIMIAIKLIINYNNNYCNDNKNNKTFDNNNVNTETHSETEQPKKSTQGRRSERRGRTPARLMSWCRRSPPPRYS